MGSDPSTKDLAVQISSPYEINPNRPIGRKQNLGFLSLRDHYESKVRAKRRRHVPKTIAIFGTDDIVPLPYFETLRAHLEPVDAKEPKDHVFALHDVCSVWDEDRNNGIDRSAVRNIMRRDAFVSEVSVAVLGLENGIIVVDVKTDGYAKSGSDLLAFDTILRAGDGKGRLERFREEEVEHARGPEFGQPFLERLENFRTDMDNAEK